MRNEDLSAVNPLRALLAEGSRAEETRNMGLIMARAGLGKTAILVQIALDCMLLGNKVLHVSIGESVDKTRRWYDDIRGQLTAEESGKNIPEFMKNRMIMTFKESAFSNAKFEERLDDLVEQDIFCPDCLIIDGYDFVENDYQALEFFKTFMESKGLKMIWFSAVSHRGDSRKSADGVPAPCHEVDGLFGNVLLINPTDNAISLDIIKCASSTIEPGTQLALDPSTMLLQKA